jgi:hypothetical protein
MEQLNLEKVISIYLKSVLLTLRQSLKNQMKRKMRSKSRTRRKTKMAKKMTYGQHSRPSDHESGSGLHLSQANGKKKPRFKSVIMKWDDKEVEDPDANTNTNNENSSDISFTFRKIMPSQFNTKDNYCEVDIQSKALRELLAVRFLTSSLAPVLTAFVGSHRQRLPRPKLGRGYCQHFSTIHATGKQYDSMAKFSRGLINGDEGALLGGTAKSCGRPSQG